MPSLKKFLDGILFKHSRGKVFFGDQPCKNCCCVPNPEDQTQGTISPSILTESACAEAGGTWGQCPRICSACDCGCVYESGFELRIAGSESDFLLWPSQQTWTPLGSFMVEPGNIVCGKQSPPLRAFRGNASAVAEIFLSIKYDCCVSKISFAFSVGVFTGEGVLCGSIDAVVEYDFSSDGCEQCPKSTGVKTITQQWVPQESGPESPATSLESLADLGIDIDDVFDPYGTLECPPLAC